MRRYRLLHLAAAALLLLPGLLALAESPVPPYGYGDWAVTDTTVVRDQTIRLRGNLTVKAGGDLLLRNVSLYLDSRAGVTYGITVEGGGSLRAEASELSVFDRNFTFWMRVLPLGKLYVLNTSISRCGGWDDPETGGLYTESDWVTIEGSHISDSRIGLYGLGASFTIANTTVRDSRAGVQAYGGAPEFRNITVKVVRDYGIRLTRSTAAVRNSTIEDVSVGDDILAEDSTLLVENSRINGSGAFGYTGRSGLRLYGTNATVTGTTFGRDYTGIYADAPVESYLRVSDSNLSASRTGIFTTSTVNTTLTAAKGFNISASDVTMYGNILVEPGGTMLVSGSSVSLNPYTPPGAPFDPSQRGRFTVRGGGMLTAQSSTLTSQERFAFIAESGAAANLSTVTFRRCGWNSSSLEDSGPYFATSAINLTDVRSYYNHRGLVFDGVRGFFNAISVSNAVESALFLRNSVIVLANSTVGDTGGTHPVLVSSELEYLNTTYSAIPFAPYNPSPSGIIRVFWFLTARVLWEVNRLPIAGASLTVQDGNGATVSSTLTNADGMVERIIVLVYVVGGGGSTTDFSPHTVTAAKYGLSGEERVTLSGSMTVNLTLRDSTPPVIRISSPSGSALLRNGTVIAAGTAGDNVGLASVMLSADGGPWVAASGLESWSFNLTLEDGTHTLRARATDLFGLTAEVSLRFETDTEPPFLTIVSPPDGLVTNRSSLTLVGTAQSAVFVTVDGLGVTLGGLVFTTELALNEGLNTVVVVATDRAGNTNSTVLHITLDTSPPLLDVTSPADGALLNQSAFTVSGTVEEGAEVTINGWVIPHEGTSFSSPLSLADGTNTLIITATDPAGNARSVRRTVAIDTFPPVLDLVKPVEGAVFNTSPVSLLIATEPGTVININGVPERAATANHTTLLFLDEGRNNITLIATDRAGNTRRIVRHVTLDTLPPLLNLSFSPSEAKTVAGTLVIYGTTEPDVRVVVNGVSAEVGPTGRFRAEYLLSDGNNTVTVTATDPGGNSVSRSHSVEKVPLKIEQPKPKPPSPSSYILTGRGAIVLVAVVAVVVQGIIFWYLARPRVGGGR